jgi:predicted transglutaminase-like cysteine proteinase
MKWCSGRRSAVILSALITVSWSSAVEAFAFSQLGRIEIIAKNKQVLSKWDRVIEKNRAEEALYVNCRPSSTGCPHPDLAQWQHFLQRISGMPVYQQIEQVNWYVNETPYQTDSATFGASDYWALPSEFFGNAGDCEDYAIAKYVSLRQLGIPTSSMKLVVLQDTRRDIAHAVLAVKVDEQTLVLDNITNRLATPAELPHYAPYYAVNEEQQWLYYDKPLQLSSETLLPATR